MESHLKNLFISRIIAGELRCRIKDTTFFIRHPSAQHYLTAEEIFQETLESVKFEEGMFSEEDVLYFMENRGCWSLEKQKKLSGLQESLDDVKVQLFQAALRSNERARVRRILNAARSDIEKLTQERYAYNFLTPEGVASAAKYRYLLGSSVYLDGGVPYWSNDLFWDRPDPYLDFILNHVITNRMNEAQYRELARTEPWSTVWSLRDCAGRGLFDKASVDLTEEQRILCVWSSVYDNIRQHPECPHESVIEDDDMLDGWMILQKREQQRRLAEKVGDEKITNQKIRDAHEVFIPADTIEDARKIHKMNDPVAAMWYKRRMELLKQKGHVGELEMPDTKQRLNMAMAQRLNESRK